VRLPSGAGEAGASAQRAATCRGSGASHGDPNSWMVLWTQKWDDLNEVKLMKFWNLGHLPKWDVAS